MDTISSLRKQLDNKEVSSVELTQKYLDNIEKHKALGAYNTVCKEEALALAKKADERICGG